MPDRKLGERACAVCRLRDGHDRLTLPDVAAHMAAIGLSRKKWPEHLVIVDAMQVTATGKLDKKAMAVLARERIKPADESAILRI